jgi:hypothetical protein
MFCLCVYSQMKLRCKHRKQYKWTWNSLFITSHSTHETDNNTTLLMISPKYNEFNLQERELRTTTNLLAFYIYFPRSKHLQCKLSFPLLLSLFSYVAVLNCRLQIAHELHADKISILIIVVRQYGLVICVTRSYLLDWEWLTRKYALKYIHQAREKWNWQFQTRSTMLCKNHRQWHYIISTSDIQKRWQSIIHICEAWCFVQKPYLDTQF